MNTTSVETPVVTLSLRVYQALLSLYPMKFRKQYAPHMYQVFRDCCLQAYSTYGVDGITRLWAKTIIDFLRSVIEQHTQKETYMSQSKLIKLSPWAFMLASIALLSMMVKSDIVAIPGSALGTILLVIGLLGLRARYREPISRFGSIILLAGVVASLTPILFMVIGSVIYAFNPEATFIRTLSNAMESGWWLLLFVGPAIALLGLFLFGLDAIHSKPMAHFNWLPILAGFWYPAYIILVALFLGTRQGDYPEEYQAAFNIMHLLQFITLLAFGFVLANDKPQEISKSQLEQPARQGGLIGK